MKNTVKDVVVLGGGTAGWISAALLKKVLGKAINLTLIESEDIGTVGVGEATIPPIQVMNNLLGFSEAEFLKKTKATIKLGINFENWYEEGHAYFHSFGIPGKDSLVCQFHHYLKKSRALGNDTNLSDYDLNYLCAMQGKFAKINSKDPLQTLPYAYHFDATLYAAFLRELCEQNGVTRIEGKVDNVVKGEEQNTVKSVQLANGKSISGDLFIDCTGFKGMLIEETLNTGYDDWSHYLPCDSAVAMPSARGETIPPYTRSIAHEAGWRWQIPLQHRNGNGVVYCSQFMDGQKAEDILQQAVGVNALAEPKHIKFTTGQRKRSWHGNVVAVGLSSGFLEPLESTSIHMIQSAILRLVQVFPHEGISDAAINEYNQKTRIEAEQIRDFLMLHYVVHSPNKQGEFWQAMREISLPERLAHKIEIFKAGGLVFKEQDDLFNQNSWIQVMLGQGIEPKDYHPVVNSIPDAQLLSMIQGIHTLKHQVLAQLPSHDKFISSVC